MATSLTQTPLPVIAEVSRIVTKVVDRITGDRVDYPLLVAAACVEALKRYGINSQIMYGQVAWIEVLNDESLIWAGCWGNHFHFWVATQFNEVIDLNTSVAHRKRSHGQPELRARYSPPILWAADVPRFYRYEAEGVAELELTEERDRRQFELVVREINEKCLPEKVAALQETDLEFPNEPILCPQRRLLDDSRGTFREFDRVISQRGIPHPPF